MISKLTFENKTNGRITDIHASHKVRDNFDIVFIL